MADILSREQLECMNFTLLPATEYNEVMEGAYALGLTHCRRLIVGVKVYFDSAVGFYTAGGSLLVLLQRNIRNRSIAIEPDFEDARPIECGYAVAFGDFEMTADSVWSRVDDNQGETGESDER